MNTITYSKRFESFEDGLREITEIVPMVKEYMFTGEAAKFDSIIDDAIFQRDDLEEYVITNLVKKLLGNLPVASNPNYPYCYSIDVGSYNVGFKTDKRLSFGWKIHTEQLTGNVYYIFRVTFPNSARKAKSEYAALENGWKGYEFKKGPRNNRFHNNKKNFNSDEEKKDEVNDATEETSAAEEQVEEQNNEPETQTEEAPAEENAQEQVTEEEQQQ